MIQLVCASLLYRLTDLQTYRLTIVMMMILVAGRSWINQIKNTETDRQKQNKEREKNNKIIKLRTRVCACACVYMCA